MKKELKFKAIQLREKGYSIKELKEVLKVSQSSISIWVKDVKLSEGAKARLQQRYTKGQLASQKSIQEKTRLKYEVSDLFASNILKRIAINKEMAILLCAMIWWCEGNKDVRNSFVFTNSDPNLIQCFLYLFRKSFDLEEKKFRILMHLHDYHNEENLKKFWMKVTRIPSSQFNNTHWKKSDHKFKKEGYNGCVKIQYNDVKITRNLHSIAKLFMERYK